MADRLLDDRRFRTLTILDNRSRLSQLIEPDFTLAPSWSRQISIPKARHFRIWFALPTEERAEFPHRLRTLSEGLPIVAQ